LKVRQNAIEINDVQKKFVFYDNVAFIAMEFIKNNNNFLRGNKNMVYVLSSQCSIGLSIHLMCTWHDVLVGLHVTLVW
jgi:hypothetical protein